MLKTLYLIISCLCLSSFLPYLRSLDTYLSLSEDSLKEKYRSVDLSNNYDGLIVSFKRNNRYTLDDLVNGFDISSVEAMINNNKQVEMTGEELFCIRFNKQSDDLSKTVINFLLDDPFVVFVEPNYIGQWFSTTPNDLDVWGHWYISEIELDKAWDVSIGSSEVKVGVIDSGIDSTHLDLVGQIDTQLSYSFSHNTGTAINPIHDHETGVASIIGAIGNNGIGMAGINWKTSLVSLRADGIDRNGDGIYDESLQYVTDAINYAANHDIPILNFSGGFMNEYTSSLHNAVSNYPGLIVCAAGNNDTNLDLFNHNMYPGAFGLSNTIVVGSSDYANGLGSESNFGSQSVHLLAPGDRIKRLSFNNSMFNDSGTSFAAPMVTGVAALLKSVNPSLTTEQIKSAILENVDTFSYLADYCITGGILNAYKAVKSVIPTYQSSGSGMSSLRDIESNGFQWFKFNSQISQTYRFQTLGNLSTSGTLHNQPLNESPIASSSSGGQGNNFAFDYYRNSIGPVYLRVQNDSLLTGPYQVKIDLAHVHQYDERYVWYNYRQHRSFCSCGANRLEGHIVSNAPPVNGYSQCVNCHGSAEMGFIHFGRGASVNQVYVVQYFSNNSYILSNGIVVLTPLDMRLYLDGLLNIPCIHDCLLNN